MVWGSPPARRASPVETSARGWVSLKGCPSLLLTWAGVQRARQRASKGGGPGPPPAPEAGGLGTGPPAHGDRTLCPRPPGPPHLHSPGADGAATGDLREGPRGSGPGDAPHPPGHPPASHLPGCMEYTPAATTCLMAPAAPCVLGTRAPLPTPGPHMGDTARRSPTARTERSGQTDRGRPTRGQGKARGGIVDHSL